MKKYREAIVYKVISGHDVHKLESLVNLGLRAGWRCQGGVSNVLTSDGVLTVQAMALTKKVKVNEDGSEEILDE